jgi:hypothetical protein
MFIWVKILQKNIYILKCKQFKNDCTLWFWDKRKVNKKKAWKIPSLLKNCSEREI